MSGLNRITRRSFVTAAAVTTAASALGAKTLGLASLNGRDAAGMPPVDWRSQGVIDLKRSRYAKLHTVPVHAVTLHEGFWQDRRKTNVSQSIPTMHALLEEHGRMDNFRRLCGKSIAAQRGRYFSDSDVYKWTEAASFADQSGDAGVFQEQIDVITDLIQRAQEPSGYLNTYYADDRVNLRMTQQAQMVGHELYNIGHLIQAAAAQYRATGDQKLLDCCLRFVDDFLLPGYGPELTKKPIVAGHPEIEMALVELYRLSGDRRHLELAGYILGSDQRLVLTPDESVYLFCGIPFVSRTKLEGHAVRAMYACCGATDYYMETGDENYWRTLNVLWEDLVRDQMYITGGVGARRKHEAFGDPYELPNLTAYGESCAAIGNMMWNWRMLHASADAKHTDVIERALYNGINSGMSLSGTLYCYRNPLAFDPTVSTPIRNPWYDTTCCPPNLERTFASLPGYFYSTSADGLYVHLFHNSTLDWKLEGGLAIHVEQQTGYPWDGRVQINVNPAESAEFTLYLRIPGWAKTTKVEIAGKEISGVVPGKYLALKRVWKPGDLVSMEMDMSPKLLVADRRVAEDQGKVAVQRGPLVYCVEDIDQAPDTSVRDLRLVREQDTQSKFEIRRQADLLGGIDVLEHPGAYTRNAEADAAESLYAEPGAASSLPTRAKMIPYYSWANRGQSGMKVWIEV
jgi:DUF1680 family protein